MADRAVFPLDSSRREVRIALVVCGAIMALLCGVPTLYLLASAVFCAAQGLWLDVPVMLTGGWIAGWFTGYFLLGLARSFTRICVDGEGVHLLRPWRQEALIPWEALQQVCLCFASSKAMSAPEPTVICFIRHGEKKNLYDRWRADNPWHYRRIIVADHTPEVEAALRAACPQEIKDLRGSSAYPLKK